MSKKLSIGQKYTLMKMANPTLDLTHTAATKELINIT